MFPKKISTFGISSNVILEIKQQQQKYAELECGQWLGEPIADIPSYITHQIVWRFM